MLSSLALIIQPEEERAGCLALVMFFSFVLVVWYDSLRPGQQIFSHVWTGLSWFNNHVAEDVSSQRHNTVPPMRLKPATA